MTTTPTLRDAAQALKPCPWCGAGETMLHVNKGTWNGRGYGEPVSVEVRHWCEPEDGQPARMVARVGRDEASAIAAWNRRAALAAPADALAEPVAWLDSGETRYGGAGDAEQRVVTASVKATLPPGRKAHFVHPLFTATQLQQAVARALAPIQQAIRDYHYALDTRMHGGVAQRNAVAAIAEALGMHWKQGQELATRTTKGPVG